MRKPEKHERPVLLALFSVALLFAALVVTAPWSAAPRKAAAAPKEPPAPNSTIPLFTFSEPAQDVVKLDLLADGHQVIGWISGAADLTGQKATVAVGDNTETLTIAEGNTFVWGNYRVTEATRATFRVGDLQRSLTLMSPAEKAPAAFFAVDRNAYRPKQTLQFAAFLRRLDDKEEWQPLKNEAVEVLVVSQRKKSVAARLKRTSDALGRIAGSYTFAEEDPLDTYTVSIPGYRGAATVTLADYRTSKIRLCIAGKVEGDKVKLKFEPRDYLDRPVAGARVQVRAQVIREPERKDKPTLDAKLFAQALAVRKEEHVRRPSDDDGLVLEMSDGEPLEFESLGEEFLMLYEAGQVSLDNVSQSGSVVAGTLEGTVEMGKRSSAEYTAPLREDWRHGRHTLDVEAVLIDHNGRAQRARERIPLTGDDRRLELSTPKRYFALNEPIRVTARPVGADGKALPGESMLVVMRLLPVQQAQVDEAALDAGTGKPGGGASAARWLQAESPEFAARKLVTALPFKGDSATIKLARPGAYKLVAITELEDGSALRNEIGCVVLAPQQFPGVVLRLDQKEFRAGAELTGAIHSRLAGARVLLTLRDSTGIRLWKRLVLKERVTDLRLALPADLRYGCTVDVLYHDAGNQVAAASEFVRVLPVGRLLDIKTTAKEVYAPGETVRFDVQVNRSEPVDLVVSVYDQALLDVAPDRSADVRDFFLADERVRREQAWEILRLKLRDVTVGELLKRARIRYEQLKESMDSDESYMLTNLFNSSAKQKSEILDGLDVSYLLGLADVERLPGYALMGMTTDAAFKDEDRLFYDVVRQMFGKLPDGWQPRYNAFTNRVEFGTSGGWGIPAPDPRDGYAMPNDSGWRPRLNFAGMGMMGMAGFGGMGGMMMGLPSPFEQPGKGAARAPFSTGANQGGMVIRRDFADAAYWNASLRTDARGKAHVEFKLPDTLASWRVVVTAVSARMHVGQLQQRFRSFKPVMVWPMLPRGFTAGDKVVFFGRVHNLSDQKQALRVRLKVDNGTILSPAEKVVEVGPKGNEAVYWTFAPKNAGFTQILMTAECAAGSDAALKRLPVAEAAEEQALTRSGFCKGTAELNLPAGIDPAQATLEITLAPSLAADMADTLDYLVEFPYGCVEQTMSRFLPALKVAQTLQRSGIKHPSLEKRLPGCVAGGIKRLLELQHDDGGWGWQGHGQSHEMMTPYALLGLLEAEKAGYAIPDDNAIERGLIRLRQFIDTMTKDQSADRIYCIHIYAHRKLVENSWWTFIDDQRKADKLSDYFLALALDLAVRYRKTDLAKALAGKLRARAQDRGGMIWWKTAGFSRWADDKFEVTAAALKALTAHDANDPLIAGVLSFFAATKHANRWNSTKDTALILFALCDYLAKKQLDPRRRAEASVSVNGGPEHKAAFAGGLIHKVKVPAAEFAGQNRLAFTGSPGTMYRAILRYRKAGRNIAPLDRGLKVTRHFHLLNGKGEAERELSSGDTVPRGSYIRCDVDVEHDRSEVLRYLLVVSAKPSGCEIAPADDKRFKLEIENYDLREDRSTAAIFHHEQAPWKFTDRCVLLAELAGEFLVPPASAELMYQTELRGHGGTFELNVAGPPGK